MNTIIFYIGGGAFILSGIIFHFSLILLGIGILLIGIAIGGSIANSIWHKLMEAIGVLKALGYETKIK
jgi:hypothetical protein